MRRFVPRWHIYESRIETFHREGLRDAFSQIVEQIPDDALLLDVEIVKRGDMTPWSHDYMARSNGVRRRNGDRMFVDDPGVFGGRGTIRTVGQHLTISTPALAVAPGTCL